MNKTAPKTATELSIIKAAAHLFSHRGYAGTSTSEIARRAKVNEVTLFRCFGSKYDLFCATLRSRLSGVAFSKELQAGLSNGVPPATILPLLFEFLLKTFDDAELLWLVLVAALEVQGTEEIYRAPFTLLFDQISAYFREHAPEQNSSGVDPSWVTHVLVGTAIPAILNTRLTLTARTRSANWPGPSATW
jgi:AcrR family transcriptional regulator